MDGRPNEHPDLGVEHGVGPLPYRQGPADAGERAVEAEEMDQVKGEDHNQVANGDHFEVSVGTVAGPRRAAHADEGNQQRDLKHKYRPVRERHLHRNTTNHGRRRNGYHSGYFLTNGLEVCNFPYYRSFSNTCWWRIFRMAMRGLS